MRHQAGHVARSTVWLALCCVLAAAAYLPILNNGFIADDYVILKRIEILKTQPFYLYQVPPENFRLVSYLIFGLLKGLAGYHAWPFYAFNIGLHLVNIVLLWRLLRILIEDEMTSRIAVLLFAVFQAPQEAIMWLAAMNETTLLFFTLLALLAWLRQRYGLAAIAYTFALFSKESALVIPLLIFLVDLYQGHRFVWRSPRALALGFIKRYALLCLLSAGFLALFALTFSKNFMLTSRSYGFGFQALWVLAKTLHRLVWPWFYIILALSWFKTRQLPPLRRIGACLIAMIVTMLPYMFIAYQSSLPSRQLYLASAVLMTLFAFLLKPLNGTPLLRALLFAFVAFNVGYLWLRKDAQFEERAAPTTQLVETLRLQRPQRTTIQKFAYPLPEIASAAVLAVPGWDPSLVSMEGSIPCEDCLRLEWDKNRRRYDASQPR